MSEVFLVSYISLKFFCGRLCVLSLFIRHISFGTTFWYHVLFNELCIANGPNAYNFAFVVFSCLSSGALVI